MRSLVGVRASLDQCFDMIFGECHAVLLAAAIAAAERRIAEMARDSIAPAAPVAQA
jgi:hypothetical protein